MPSLRSAFPAARPFLQLACGSAKPLLMPARLTAPRISFAFCLARSQAAAHASGAARDCRRPRPIRPSGFAPGGLARALWKLGKPGEAAALYGQIVDAFPEDPGAPRAALDQAGALEAAGQADLALAAYLRVSGRYPGTNQSLQAELGRARLLARTGRSSDAAGIYMRVLFDRGRRTRLASMGETPTDLFAELGWALVDSQENEEADRIFAALLEDDPQSPRAIDARFNLAESANQSRDFAAVIRLLSPLVSVPAERASKQGIGPAKAGQARRDNLAWPASGRSCR